MWVLKFGHPKGSGKDHAEMPLGVDSLSEDSHVATFPESNTTLERGDNAPGLTKSTSLLRMCGAQPLILILLYYITLKAPL